MCLHFYFGSQILYLNTPRPGLRSFRRDRSEEIVGEFLIRVKVINNLSNKNARCGIFSSNVCVPLSLPSFFLYYSS